MAKAISVWDQKRKFMRCWTSSATYNNGLPYRLQNYMHPACNIQMIQACAGFCTVDASNAFPSATFHSLPSRALFLVVLALALAFERPGFEKDFRIIASTSAQDFTEAALHLPCRDPMRT